MKHVVHFSIVTIRQLDYQQYQGQWAREGSLKLACGYEPHALVRRWSDDPSQTTCEDCRNTRAWKEAMKETK